MKKIGNLEELAAIGRHTLEQAHTIINRIAVFGSTAEEVRKIVNEAAKKNRKLTNDEQATIDSLMQLVAETTMLIEKDMKGILQFGRGLQFEVEPVDINQFIDGMIGAMESKGKFAITYNVELCSEIAKKVILDKYYISNCILDLVKNAVEADAKGVKVRTSAEMTPEGPFVEIAVINDGKPIPEEVKARMFDFSFTTKKKGNGVGLAQVRKIIEAHGGHVAVHSSKQETKFCIFLPL